MRRGRAARLGALGLAALVAVTALVALAAVTALAPQALAAGEDGWAKLRRSMVDEQIRGRGITAPGVLSAMGQVPRHMFVPPAEQGRAYADQPLPFDAGRTIYQPYVVALMTSLLDLDGSKRVLEVGTGSGYHAAVLSRLAREVYSIEISGPVASQAEKRLTTLGYVNVHVRSGDGYRGWPEKAPFDAILVSAAPPKIPKPLLDQLRVGGKMVVAEGGFIQDLLVITKTADGLEKRTVIPVRLSPMTGKIREGG
ncbi:MAG TPA: protein-L-isoaspartate(D-aspartate) O-methyltransferase [Thermoanaerobaculia bacterium]|nr:protein-L-isoaspartate(D-aspartate) O-methyltransferase [Thermoanaerobaculia bacterium]